MPDEIERSLGQLFYSSPLSELNDPFEGNPSLVSNNPKEVRDWLTKFYRHKKYRGKTTTGLELKKIARERGYRLAMAKKLTSPSIDHALLEIKSARNVVDNN